MRRLNVEALGAVEALASSSLLANGQISLVSLDAVVERFGPRWESRRETVYNYTERILTRELADRGHFLRVSETDFLVAAPHLPKYAAQLQCLRCLRDVLTYFLGNPQSMDLRVREVTQITANGLEAVLVNPAALAASADRERLQLVATGAAESNPGPTASFVDSGGRALRVSCALEPVFELKSYNRIGNRIVRRVLSTETETPLTIAELQTLSRSEVERIDLTTIARGLERLRSDGGRERPLSLIIPVSYISLSHQRGRTALTRLFSDAKALVRAGVICEVCDIENVPQAALLEATSLVKPFCMFAVGRLRAAPDRSLGNLRGAGLQALSFDAPPGVLGDAEFHGWARGSVEVARTIVRSVLIYRVGSPRQVGIAGLLGASHAGLRAGGQSVQGGAAEFQSQAEETDPRNNP